MSEPLEVLIDIGNWHLDKLNKLWNILWGLGKVGTALFGLITAIGGLLWQFTDIASALNGIASGINTLTDVIEAMPLHPVMQMVNRVFPLNEVLFLEFALLGFALVCASIRIVKSLIPTLA